MDEIIARHIQPMASFAQDVMSYKYYMVDVYSEETSAIEKFLHSEKKRSPTRIPLVYLNKIKFIFFKFYN